PERLIDLQILNRVLVDEQVNALWLTAGLFEQWSESLPELPLLNYVVAGGDVLNPEAVLRVQRALSHVTLINGYGPTENTTFTCCHRMEHKETQGGSIPIGRAINGTSLYVLNAEQHLSPVGVPGELYVGGSGVARGYLNQPALTEEKFITNPFGEGRLYRTGDLVRYLPNQELDFIGRVDNQVKIRGFRIEPGEIEQVLVTHSGVNSAVVLVQESASGDKQLVGYVVSPDHVSGNEEKSIDFITELKGHIRQSLPDYMVPAVFMVLEAIPLTANGKLDRKALPKPDMSLQLLEYVAPSNETENILCEIWQEVLGIERVGITDNFFESGGHSLLATRVIAKINQKFTVELALKVIFSFQTIEQLVPELLKQDQVLGRPKLEPVSRDQALLPSFAQQRLWLLDKIDGGSAHYNMPTGLKLKGELNKQALEKSLCIIVERHESLRTYFAEDEKGQALQIIRSGDDFSVQCTDLSELEEAARESALSEVIAREAESVFDLSHDFMLRASLVKLGPQEHVLLVTMHHIASDGWSMSLLINEFSTLYNAFSKGEADPLAPLAIQYADYAHWQRNWLQGEVLEKQLGYWTNQLANLPVVHNLPLDHARPEIQRFVGANYSQLINAELSQALNSVCQENGATLFMGLHGLFSVLLSRYSNETDIVIGTPIANREQEEVADLIGFFVNSLVLRSDLSGNPSFTELVAQSKEMLLGAYAHQQVSFEQIVEKLQPERSLRHSALFQVTLVLHNNAEGQLSLPSLSLETVGQASTVAKYDLTLNVTESDEGLILVWQYNSDLFNALTIERLAGSFECLLGSLVTAPENKVLTAELLSADEIHQQLVQYNDTAKAYETDKCLHELFEAQVLADPDAIALVFEGEKLTYAQLNAKANQLAHYLVEHRKVTPDTLVGLFVERSLSMVIGILGILKAGAAYVPLDPEYPAERLAYMLEDAGLSLVLTQSHLLNVLSINDDQAECLDEPDFLQNISNYSSDNISVSQLGLSPQHLAYVIYTSGSTGRPKGVMIEHHSVTNLAFNLNELGLAESGKQWGWLVSFAFDSSIKGLSQLVCGTSLHIISDACKRDTNALSDVLPSLSVLDCTPTLVELWLDAGLGAQLPQLIIGGEPISPRLWARLVQWQAEYGKKAVNVYGPTECTVNSTLHMISGNKPLIGNCLANVNAFVLDTYQRLVPTATSGELFIGGAGLARGYLHQPELTAERFIDNPFYDANDITSSKRLYKTGDLVRRSGNGALEFLGRNDDQVKIRGFRIELGEIESQLAICDGVNGAVVAVKENAVGDSQLVAYILSDSLASDKADVDGNDEESRLLANDFIALLRQGLSRVLPEYMIPTAFVLLDKIPLTANGKLDKKALPAPDMSEQQSQYVAPSTETEKILCEIWQEVLGLEQVGVNDNFFALGGHSLLVMQVIAQAKVAGLAIEARQLFTFVTLFDLAREITTSGECTQPLFEVPANLIPEGCQHITPDMLLLVDLQDSDITTLVSQIPGGAGNIQDIYPLASLQQGILFHHMLNKENDPYVLPLLFSVENKAALDGFIEALQFIINRHDVLRTSILWQGLSTPVQVVLRQAELQVSWPELDAGQDIETQMQALSAPDKQWMDITQGPLLRLQVAQSVDSGQCFILLQLHHIISDHVGLDIIQKEVVAYLAGQGESLTPAQPYRDFIAHVLHQAKVNDATAYFTEMLGDIDTPTTPFDLVDVQGDGSNIVELRDMVPDDVAAQLRTFAKTLKLSPAVLFHTAWAMVVAGCSGRDDVVFGTVFSGRLQGLTGSENMMGMFINTLPVRVKLEDNSAIALVRQVEKTLQALLPYEQASLALAQHCSALPGDTSLFSAMFNYRHSGPGTASGESEELSDDLIEESSGSGISVITGQERTNYPLSLSVDDFGEAFGLDVQVDGAISPERVINYMQTALASLVDCLGSATEQAISALTILPETELHQQLVTWNDTSSDYPQDKCIHELFEAQVLADPDAIALVFEEEKLTYGELNAKANQLAHYLVEQKQIRPDSLVGLCVERSFDMLIGMLGILKAGGAYVPLDPGYPAERLAYMLEDAKLTHVLTQSHLLGQIPVSEKQALCLDDQLFQQILSEQPESNIGTMQTGQTSSHLAYVIYTSGSTGKPKASLLAHRGVCNLLVAQSQAFHVTRDSRVLQFASIAFDAATSEWVMALCNGAILCLVAQDTIKDPLLLDRAVSATEVTHATLPPALLPALNQACWKSVKHLIVAGEACSPALAKLWCVERNFYNAYGPSESTVCATISCFDSLEHMTSASLPIGKPINNIQVYVLDEREAPVPIGVVGELYISGVGLSRGYLNQDRMTEEKFIQHPFLSDPQARLYKTGDLVRWLSDGDLEFIGRTDHQIKIRGFRIELGEIEHSLIAHDDVNEVIVIASESASGDKQLVAYVVSLQSEQTEQIPALITSMRVHLQNTLPDYMVPSAFVVLDKLPLTANGKVDRKALPNPDMPQQLSEYVAPSSETEIVLCEIWQDVLDIERVGITDNFFELGGHSLLATQVIAKINQKFTVELALKTIFTFKNIEQMVPELLKQDQVLARPNLKPVSRDQILLPSFAQQRLWLLDKIDGGSAHYNMPTALKLRGELDKDALEKALETIVERHESLRTCFAEDEKGQAIQIIRSADDFSVKCTDLSELEEAARESALSEVISSEADTVFDLSHDLMLRACLVQLGSQEHVLLVTMHHIASDGWSMSLLINEFSTLYNAFTKGEADPLAPLAIQYADYAHWQRNWLQGDVLEKQLGYWTNQLADLPVVHNLPLDHVRPEIQSFAGENHYQLINAELTKALNSVCQENGATLFMGLHGLFSVLLSRHSNETDIVIGTPIANREQAEVADLIGFFVNSLVLRSDLSGNPSFTELVVQSKEMLLGAYSHQQVSFEQIVEKLQPERSLRHSPLFQVMLVLQNNETGELDLSGLSLESVGQSGTVAKYDLTLNVTESDEGLMLGWQYNRDLFNALTIKRLADSFERLLDVLVTAPENKVLTAELLSVDEIHQQLVQWNDTAATYPTDTCIHELFEAQVANNPDTIAVVFEDSQLTYGELNGKANQLAHYLVEEKHIIPDTLVGLCVERSLEMIIGLLAILKAGGAYVPLDPDYPEARLVHMIEDAQLVTVLTQTHLQDKTPVTAQQAVCLDEAGLQEQLKQYPTSNLVPSELSLTSSNLAYVIYTSGSTGKPKGVLIEHNALLNNIVDNASRFGVDNSSVFLQNISINFDAGTWVIWMSLSKGASLTVTPSLFLDVSSDSTSEGNSLFKGVSHLMMTPSSLALLEPENFEGIKSVIVGGEACSQTLAQAWQGVGRFFNAYGPTEAAICSTVKEILPEDSITLGGPNSNVICYVLNNETCTPVGTAGELHIGGAGLARGYLNQPELTAEKFISNPFYDANNPNSSERLYKTGDLVRWLPEGELEFLGRLDDQVKIRGFRIELGEIEHALAECIDVNEAIVLATEIATGNKQLVAYVVTDKLSESGLLESNLLESKSNNETVVENTLQRQDFIASLKQNISQDLPDYMVPSVYILLDKLPLTPNGKLDKKALPAPDMSGQLSQYVAPSNETENVLCEIWQEVLGIERVGITDNFFESGGHSLLATRVIAKINQKFTVELALKVIFSFQTIEQLVPELLKQDQVLGRPKLEPVSRDQALLPSFAQQRLWMLDKIDGGSAHYNMPTGLKLKGELNKQALEKALCTIVERHESLRTYFAEDEKGQALQIIRSGDDFSVQNIDLSALEEAERESALRKVVAREAGTVFDLSHDFMLRACLVQLGPQEHVLLVTMHHIASDGWSMSLLINEFSTLHKAFAKGEADPLAPLAIQYADYAHWQRNWLQGEVLEQKLGYWTNQLADLPVVHNLPLDHARPEIQSFDGTNHYQFINAELGKVLNSVCQANGATLFMGLHGLFSVLLSRYSNETDIVIGTPIANREQAEVADLIGFFVNSLVLRSDLSGNPSFTELIAQSKEMLLGAYAHQQVSFEQIVEKLQPERSLRHSPLFQVMLILQNNETGELDLSGLSLESVGQSGTVAKYDLTLTVIENEEGLVLVWEYNTDLFAADTIEQMGQCFEHLLSVLVKKPDDKVLSASLLDEKQSQQALVNWNDTAMDYPQDKCIHALFEAQAEKNPDVIALVFEDREISYGELNSKANQLAHYLLKNKQVKPDTLVGLCLERSVEMVIGIWGILKAGGAYVPLDPDYPADRLAYMLDDAKLSTVLTSTEIKNSLAISDSQALCLDVNDIQAQLAAQDDSNPTLEQSGLSSAHLAYVIYTSGSTGKPKGVMIEHSSLMNRIHWMDRQYTCTADDRILQKTPFSFDVSVWEFVWPLTSGARLVLAKPQGHKDPVYLTEFIQAQGITKLHFVPSMLSGMLSLGDLAQCHSLKQVFCSGEALLMDQVKAFQALLPEVELHNLYGPTEAAIDVSHWDCSHDMGESVPIGRAIDNTQLLVLNEQLSFAPPGVAGELFIGGAGLARGYLNRSDLTREKFISNPFYQKGDANSSERLYRTGDLVRRLADGELEYLGRLDHQVKLRGFRIELGEIEQVLVAHHEVSDVAVLAIVNANGDQQLVAYLVSSQEDHQSLTVSVKAQLQQVLPEYMVPAVFIVLDTLPLTANGKLDRKALPAPDMSGQVDEYVAPTTATEKILCEIWQDVLGLEQVGINDNFFALGGHSLLVMQVIAKGKAAELAIETRQLFALATLADLARELSESCEEIQPLFVAQANLIPEGCQHITPQMLPLVDLQDSDITTLVSQIPGGAGNIQDIYSLAPLQQGILFHHMLNEENDPYVMPLLFSVENKTALDSFIEALQFIIKRHDVLRTSILWQGLSTPVQVVLRQAELQMSWPELDASQDIETQMQALSAPDKQWMDITQGPLLRLQLAESADSGQCFILLQLHHIISDHVGLEIIQREVMVYLDGQGERLAPALPYRDFIAHVLHQEKVNDATAYFTEALGDIDTPTTPFDLVDVQGDGSQIVELREKVPDDIATELRAVAKTLKLSPAVLFHTAWAMVIAGCSGRDDVVFGTVFSGRLQGLTGAENMMGMFINTLPVRVKLEDNSAIALVRQVQQALQELLSYEQASLALAQQCSALQGDSSLFSAMLNYRHSGQGTASVTSEALSEGSSEEQSGSGIAAIGGQERSNYPFSLAVDDLGEAFALDVHVDDAISPERVMNYMQTALASLVECLASTTEQGISALTILPETELHQQLVTWNDTSFDYPQDKCMHELFEAQALADPDAIALVFEGEALSYAALNTRANQLAHYLVEQNQVTPDTMVGVCVERSIEMVIALLAVHKAGAAYVPLDPNYPASRLAYMLEDSGLSLVLSQRTLAGKLPFDNESILYIDDSAVFERYSVQNPVVAQTGGLADSLAYVIYTSGSTGNPKGVMLEHHNLTNFLLAMQQRPGLESKDALLAVTSFSFDIHTLELFLPLICGARVVLASQAEVSSPTALAHLIEAHGVTTMQATPATWKMLTNDNWQPSREMKLLCGGEALSDNLKDELLSITGISLWNMYGPTETSVWSSVLELTLDQKVTIGGPVENTQFYVLTDALKPVPFGVAGELFIGGAGLARGYLNLIDLTREKFISNPFYQKGDANSSERLYRTGDLVRRIADGELEYLGRLDHQVKLRGFRIELGEIEQVLLTHQAVSDAAVLATVNANGDQQLVGYLVASQEDHQSLTVSVKAHLQQALPEYMVPAVLMVLEAMPLTANGKIDRKALPAPDMSGQMGEYVAPTTATETILCEIWQDVLGIEQVGVNDNFFALGGHSLLVMQVVVKAKAAGLTLETRQLFVFSTLSDLARELMMSGEGTQSVFEAPANLIPEGCQFITPDMLPLVDLQDSDITTLVSQIPGGAGNIQDIYSLAPLQQGILFHHMLNKENDPYVMPTLFSVENRAALNDFVEALQFIINRHDVLRTSILWQGLSTPVQVVTRQAELQMSWPELDSAQDIETQMQALSAPDKQWMDITQGPLLHLQLAESADSGECFILLQLHHIISDQAGLMIIQQEVMAYLAGQGERLAPALPYRDFIAHVVHQAEVNDATAYFTEMLGDIDTPTTPFDLVDVQGDGSQIVELKNMVPNDIATALRAVAKTLKLSPAVLFHTAWAMVVAGCSGRDDVVFGTVLSGRLQGVTGAENMMGMFINTLPVRVKLEDNSAIALVRQVQQVLQSLLPYEQASLALAQQCSALSGDTSLFSAMLNYRHSGQGTASVTSEALSEGSSEEQSGSGIAAIGGQERSNYPFSLAVDDLGEAFALDVHVDDAISPERVMNYMQTALASLVECLASTTEQGISALTILPETELHQQLVTWNDTSFDYPQDKCMHELFEAQALADPDAIALVFEGEALSYAALNTRANQLAHYLVEQNQVTPDTMVGVCVERSIEMVIALLAVHKAGAAYVPLDPNYPASRLAYMLEDSGLSLVLSQRTLAGKLPFDNESILYIDDSAVFERYSVQNPVVAQTGGLADSLAYVIYTSGSTGNPKGVMLEHHNLTNFLLAMQQRPGLESKDALLAVTSFSFDIHTLELFLPLICGARVVLASQAEVSSPTALAHLIEAHGVTTMQATPATWKMLTNDNWQPSREMKLLCGGEALSDNLKDELLSITGISLWNMYGPTETSVWSSVLELTLDQKVTIGGPVENTQFYVLTDALQPVPFGVVGELFIGGEGVARGYLNQPDLTAEKFINNPFGSGRLYSTGDLVKWLEDGNIEYLGRTDDQVKIRGHRIELGEVETTIMSHNAIREAVVVARDEPVQLVAYILADQKDGVIDDLRGYLNGRLPIYMIPSIIITLDTLPLTPNGKLDRKALPDPGLSMQDKASYVAPETETEKVLSNLWAEILKLDATKISRTANFFDLGGHSILSMQLISEIRLMFNVELSLTQIFSTPTLNELASSIALSEEAVDSSTNKITRFDLEEELNSDVEMSEYEL
ncbi:MAG: non-ribosomal peptide synthase/polyketide synthase, partial [Alteromonadaceae bacterium]|nr:non-ribosomal peptide synthase/polyketide synthase [Alteromonadaceae bacterium]